MTQIISRYIKNLIEINNIHWQTTLAEPETIDILKTLIDKNNYEEGTVVFLYGYSYPVWWFLCANEDIFNYFKSSKLAQNLFASEAKFSHNSTETSSLALKNNILLYPYIYNYNLNVTHYLVKHFNFNNENHITYIADNPEYYLQMFEQGLAHFDDKSLSTNTFTDLATILKIVIKYSENNGCYLHGLDMIERYLALGAIADINVLESDKDILRGNQHKVVDVLPWEEYIQHFAPNLAKAYETKKLKEKIDTHLENKENRKLKKI